MISLSPQNIRKKEIMELTKEQLICRIQSMYEEMIREWMVLQHPLTQEKSGVSVAEGCVSIIQEKFSLLLDHSNLNDTVLSQEQR